MAFIRRAWDKYIKPNSNKYLVGGTGISSRDYLWGGLSPRQHDIIPTDMGIAQAYAGIVAVNRSVQLIVNAINALEWQIVVTDADGNEQVIDDKTSHEPKHILHRAIVAHGEHYHMPYIERLVYSNVLFDEMYSELVKEYGQVRGVRWLNPVYVEPQTLGNRIDYFRYSAQGETFTLYPDDMLYWHGYNAFDDLRGQSNTLTVLDAANIDRNLKRFIRDFFANGALPPFIFSPQGETDASLGLIDEQFKQELERQLSEWHKGSGNFFRSLVSRRPINVQSADYPDVAGQFSINADIKSEIYQAFGIPLELAGGQETRYKFGNEVYAVFMDMTIKPIVMAIEEYMNRLLRHIDPHDWDVRFQFDRAPFTILTEHDQLTASIAQSNLASTIISMNEARKQQGLEIDEHLEGLYMVGGVPVPAEELRNLWQYQYKGQYANDLGVNVSQMLPSPDGTPPHDGTPPPNADVLDDALDDIDIDEAMRNIPDKYADIDFGVTSAMREEAERGLAWRKEYGRGGTATGVARARDIINRDALPHDTWRRVKAFFDRHENNKEAEGFERGEDGYPSAGRIAWALWGGDAGQSRAESIVSQMNTADEANKSDDYHEGALKHSHACDDTCQHGLDDALASAINEMDAWRKFSMKGYKRDFDVKHIPDAIAQLLRDDISASDGNKSLIWLAVEGAKGDAVRMWGESHTERTKSAVGFRQDARRTLRATWQGDMDAQGFIDAMSAIIDDYYKEAYERGLRDAGIPREYHDRFIGWVALANTDKQWLNGFANDIVLGRDNPIAPLFTRLDMWVGEYERVYSQGLLDGSDEDYPVLIPIPPELFRRRRLKLMWRVGVAEHCRDCLNLDKRVYYADAWREASERGIFPRSRALACNGYNCKCDLFVVGEEVPVTRGAIPKLVNGVAT